MRDLDVRCKKCDRYLNLKGVHIVIAKVRCPNSKCKALNNVKIIPTDVTESQLRYTFKKEN